MKTRKTLVPFDINNPEKNIAGFLYPNIEIEPISSFRDIKSGREWSAGIVVFVGREISKDDIFASIVDSGTKIRSVPTLLSCLDEYVHQTAQFKIVDVIGIKSSADGFQLVKLEKPRRAPSKLPG